MDLREQIEPEVARSLLRTALLAIWERQYDRAHDILLGLSSVRLDSYSLTYAYTLLYQALGQADRAIELLRQSLRAHPANDMAKSLLGYVLQQDGRIGWRELLQEVIANDAHAHAVELAQRLLQSEGSRARALNVTTPALPHGCVRA